MRMIHFRTAVVVCFLAGGFCAATGPGVAAAVATPAQADRDL